MKKFLAGIIGAAAFAGNALAADLPARVPYKATPNEVVAFNWGGFYTASSLGGGWQHINGTVGGLADNTRATNAWSGSHVGIQGQWGNWVLGVEGSYSSPLNGKFASSVGGTANCAVGAGFTCNSRIRGIWAGGAKVGYAVGDWMVYGAGGYANARIEDMIITAPGGIGVTTSKANHGGWYAGGGVDWYVTRIWYSDLILGVEYRHYDFGNKAHTDPGFAGIKTFKADVDTVMAKATFKWVGMGPLTPFVQ